VVEACAIDQDGWTRGDNGLAGGLLRGSRGTSGVDTSPNPRLSGLNRPSKKRPPSSLDCLYTRPSVSSIQDPGAKHTAWTVESTITFSKSNEP
jgi:hypothetical protein